MNTPDPKNRRDRLGRGLGALIPDAGTFTANDGDRIHAVPLDAIEPNPAQPRREFEVEELNALADSIREQGLLQPVVVRKLGPDAFQLIAGERRWRAAARAGLHQIPAIIRETHDEEMLPLALVENLLRENLNPIEEALAFRQLAVESQWTQDDIADQIGRSRAHVANTLRLLKLPEEIRTDVASGRLTSGHARALLACASGEEMFALRDQILSQDLSVRESEAKVSPKSRTGTRKNGKRTRRSKDRSTSPELRDLEERLQHSFGTPVQIHEKTGRGRVSLEFYSYDDLTRLCDLLLERDSGR